MIPKKPNEKEKKWNTEKESDQDMNEEFEKDNSETSGDDLDEVL